MRPEGPRTWLINSATGWPLAGLPDPAGAVNGGLRLAAAAGGPLALDSPDGSLGGLLLPQGVAIDREGLPYLLSPDPQGILRWRTESNSFFPLAMLGEKGSDARQFCEPSNIAISGSVLAVADTGNSRVSLFDLRTLALLALLPIPAGDVAATPDGFFAVDVARGVVWSISNLSRRPRRLFSAGRPAESWSRIAVDRERRIYLRDGARLSVFEKIKGAWRPAEDHLVDDPAQIRHRFDPPAIRGRHADRIEIPASILNHGRSAKPGGEVETRVGSLVYVLNRKNREVTVWDSNRRVIRHRFGPIDSNLAPVFPADPAAWDPVDLATAGCGVYLLDSAYGRIFLHGRGKESLRLILHYADAAGKWDRIAIDSQGCLALLAGSDEVWFFSPAGKLLRRSTDPADFRLFTRRPDLAKPQPLSDLPARFLRNGSSVTDDPAREPRPVLYASATSFLLGPLDSEIYDCSWHRIQLSLADLPPGSAIEVGSITSNERSPIPMPESQVAYRTVGPLQPPPTQDGTFPQQEEFLIQSRSGQFLWIEIKLTGDQFHTPAVRQLRIHYPRETYLRDLPAVYSFDEESRNFLERYLSVFQTEIERMETEIGEVEKNFDPDAVPAGNFLLDLAERWLGGEVERTWTPDQQRTVLRAIPKAMDKRGTPEGLRLMLTAYLSALSGVSTDKIERLGFPRIVEGFAEREFLTLPSDGLGKTALWSADKTRRFQLGIASQEGEYELVSSGDPELDVFAFYAHRFCLFLPSAWIRTAADERILRRAVDRERPAHTSYELRLIEPGMQVGIQSTLGLDTILGDWPAAQLDCPADPTRTTGAPPPNRLGQDTLLTCDPNSIPLMQLTPAITLGRDSLLS